MMYEIEIIIDGGSVLFDAHGVGGGLAPACAKESAVIEAAIGGAETLRCSRGLSVCPFRLGIVPVSWGAEPASHYTRSEVAFNDVESLIDALIAMGWRRDEIEVHKEAQHLYGYTNDVRPETAHVIIRKENVQYAANDIGINLETGEMIVSDFDQGTAQPAAHPDRPAIESARRHGGYNTEWVKELKSEYAGAVIKRQIAKLKAKGKIVRVKSDTKKGTKRVIKLHVG